MEELFWELLSRSCWVCDEVFVLFVGSRRKEGKKEQRALRDDKGRIKMKAFACGGRFLVGFGRLGLFFFFWVVSLWQSKGQHNKDRTKERKEGRKGKKIDGDIDTSRKQRGEGEERDQQVAISRRLVLHGRLRGAVVNGRVDGLESGLYLSGKEGVKFLVDLSLDVLGLQRDVGEFLVRLVFQFGQHLLDGLQA